MKWEQLSAQEWAEKIGAPISRRRAELGLKSMRSAAAAAGYAPDGSAVLNEATWRAVENGTQRIRGRDEVPRPSPNTQQIMAGVLRWKPDFLGELASGRSPLSLATEVRRRREQLGMSFADAVAAAEGRVTSAHWEELEGGAVDYTERTLRAIDAALRWEPGSARGVLERGESPRPRPPGPREGYEPTADQLEKLRENDAELLGRVVDLQVANEDLESWQAQATILLAQILEQPVEWVDQFLRTGDPKLTLAAKNDPDPKPVQGRSGRRVVGPSDDQEGAR